jgi:hypothetical protein
MTPQQPGKPNPAPGGPETPALQTAQSRKAWKLLTGGIGIGVLVIAALWLLWGFRWPPTVAQVAAPPADPGAIDTTEPIGPGPDGP